jgi:glycosyltransferase involved in cell wall biosynthesis
VTLSRVSDETIWDLYDLARFSVFCSLNEGFGLPVVESLSHGTPVITSDFGSMRALGVGHGGLTVSPLDIDAMTAAMIRLLRDDALHAELVVQTETTPATSWESYADDLWKLAELPSNRLP